MKKKITALFVTLALLVTYALPSFAYMAHNPGPITYAMESEYITSFTDADPGENSISFFEGGKVTYDFYLPFNALSVDIAYMAAADCNFSLKTESKTFTVALSAAEQTATLEFDIIERMGERVMTVSADGAVDVSSITFNKELVDTANSDLSLCDLTENEQAVETAIIVDTKASAIMVNGGRRYINNDDVSQVPENFKGRVYLPARTLATMFGYYLEDMPEKDYLLLRNDKTEYAFYKETSYKETFAGSVKENIENVVIYKNGEAYLPLRYFAEQLGKTVGYKDGIIAIDNKFAVKKILNSDELMGYVNEMLSPFHPTDAVGKTYYVAQKHPSASDENDGLSEDKPFKSLAAAAEVADAGDTVIVKSGVYREVLTPQNSGRPNAPIVFRAEGDDVTISAAEEISGFTHAGNGMYVAPTSINLGDGRNQIFYNNESMVEARYPNGPGIESGDNCPPLPSLWPVIAEITSVEGDDYRAESTTLLNQPDNYWQGGTFVTMRGNCYALSSCKIESSGNGYLTLTDVPVYYWGSTVVNSQWDYGFITGHINALDTNEEWIIKDGMLYFIPPEGADTNNLKVEIKARHLVADLSENSYVKLQGFNTIGGSIKMNESQMCTLDSLNMKYLNHYILSKDQHSGFIDDANIRDTNGAPSRGEVGIYIGGTENVVINNKMSVAAAAAIYGVGSYIYIANNDIGNCGYAGSYVSGLYFTGEAWKPSDSKRGGHTIVHNTIYNTGRSVMQHTRPAGQGLWPYLAEEIAYNDFHDAILTSLDTGITYEYYAMLGNDKHFTQMHHNLLYQTVAMVNPYSMGIYHDGGAENIDTYCNVVFSQAPNPGYTSGYVYTQTLDIARAYCPVWNNVEITTPIEGGKAALKPANFPNGKPFHAGTLDGMKNYLVNYNAMETGHTLENVYYAKDANLSTGTVLDKGAAVLDEVGKYVAFENVDFGTGHNYISIEYFADKYNTGDKIEVIIGDSIETGKTFSFNLTAKAPGYYDVNFLNKQISTTKGIKNIYIRAKNPKSAKIYSVRIEKFRIDLTPLNASKVYGGRFDSYTGENASMPPQVRFTVTTDPKNPMVNNTWSGTTIIYDEVTFDTDVTKVAGSFATGENYGDQKVEFRVDTPDGPALGTFRTPQTDSWFAYDEVEATLTTPIKAGKHKVYVTFGKTSTNRSVTSNMYWFKFFN